MRVLWLIGALCLAGALILDGRPYQPAQQISLEEFSQPPGTKPLDTNLPAGQTIFADVSNRLASASIFQQTMIATSAP